MSDGAGVVVVGSVHVDLQVEVPRLPQPGETVLGTGHRRTPGGKGANQAVAAALAGQPVTLIGRVGDDPDGQLARSEIAARGVDVSRLSADPEHHTGVALITVDGSGRNQIAVSPGASGRLSPQDVARHSDVIAAARVLLVQLEVPIETVLAAVDRAGARTTVVLNPAPALALPPELLRRVDLLVPNLIELGQLAGAPEPAGLARITRAARALAGRAGARVVVTRGAAGALLVDGAQAIPVPGEPAKVVDTTGAGDAFCGTLAGALAAGQPLPVAVAAANRFAAASTTRPGAFASFLADPGSASRCSAAS